MRCESLGRRPLNCVERDAACVPSPGGDFCAASCVTAADCPDGFACASTAGVDGIASLQCASDTSCLDCTDPDSDGAGVRR